MAMIEAVHNFIQAVENQEHILPLIQQADLQGNIVANEQAIQLMFKSGVISVQEPTPDGMTQFEISGSQDALLLLFEGKERLRVLEQNDSLKVNASLRTALWLESVFYLTRSDYFLAKII